jgi:hypothetical protein
MGDLTTSGLQPRSLVTGTTGNDRRDALGSDTSVMRLFVSVAKSCSVTKPPLVEDWLLFVWGISPPCLLRREGYCLSATDALG